MINTKMPTLIREYRFEIRMQNNQMHITTARKTNKELYVRVRDEVEAI